MKNIRAITFIALLVSNQFAFSQTETDTIACLLYTSDAADERSSVDLGGRRIIKKKKYNKKHTNNNNNKKKER